MKCSCGERKDVRLDHLRGGATTSCGCAHAEAHAPEDLTGRHFGALTVIALASRQPVYWTARCACGKETRVYAGHLRAGRIRSCGCGRLAPRDAVDPPAIPGAKWIALGGGGHVLVDLRDWGWASARPWFRDDGGYAACKDGRLHDLLGRGRMGIVAAMIDHKNRNRLDCRRRNLRGATTAQSAANQPRRRDNTSGFKGVDFCKATGKWRARCRAEGHTGYGGAHNTAEAAARAYDALARRLHGRFASLNFPKEH